MEQKNLICVVDDDRSMTRMLRRVLTSAGFDVALFHSAEAFLHSLNISETACLILDVDLPGMSGIDLQTHLRVIGLTIPILFISANATEQVRQRALTAGALGLLSKPFDIESLLRTIQSLEPVTSG